jgi:hypothetical protein
VQTKRQMMRLVEKSMARASRLKNKRKEKWREDYPPFCPHWREENKINHNTQRGTIMIKIQCWYMLDSYSVLDILLAIYVQYSVLIFISS